jgi:hypothetical protein
MPVCLPQLAFDVGFLDKPAIEQADKETFHRGREAWAADPQ